MPRKQLCYNASASNLDETNKRMDKQTEGFKQCDFFNSLMLTTHFSTMRCLRAVYKNNTKQYNVYDKQKINNNKIT